MSQNHHSYKKWLETSIRKGSIYCFPKSDIKLDSPIARGAYGVVYKATVKQRIAKKRHSILSGMTTVAVKTLLLAEHGREEDLHRQFIKEVDIIYSMLLLPLCRIFMYESIVDMKSSTLAKTPQGSKWPSKHYSTSRFIQRYVTNDNLVDFDNK